MTSSNENIFRVTGHLCGEFTGDRWTPHKKASDAGALMFSFICVWINAWVNNREAGDLRCDHAHYDVIAMSLSFKCCCKVVTVYHCVNAYTHPGRFTNVPPHGYEHFLNNRQINRLPYSLFNQISKSTSQVHITGLSCRESANNASQKASYVPRLRHVFGALWVFYTLNEVIC